MFRCIFTIKVLKKQLPLVQLQLPLDLLKITLIPLSHLQICKEKISFSYDINRENNILLMNIIYSVIEESFFLMLKKIRGKNYDLKMQIEGICF